MSYTKYLLDAIKAALQAGQAILEVYDTDFEVTHKSDQSPLTVADQRAHEIIKSHLSLHGIPSISEEGKSIPYEARRNWPLMWIVDPLDGTKEFIKRNGEFTVNIALVADGIAVAGVVYAPVLDWLYFASRDIGAFKWTDVRQSQAEIEILGDLSLLLPQAQKLPLHHPQGRPYTIVGSRSHGTAELEAFVEDKRKEKGQVDFVQAGSALKICLVAEGKADIYPRLGPTMEWDTAAGQAVAQCAGATMHVYQSSEALQYNKENLLNPWFVVER
ncbi:MAG: 3'(2'),5'-bisphosphate nucleotidase CysQ [Desulfobacteraceae bacterium]|nr:3'(2'),5'-bisphosphate nucleotidase CysQ [Desulfobacteraceae bacterium]